VARPVNTNPIRLNNLLPGGTSITSHSIKAAGVFAIVSKIVNLRHKVARTDQKQGFIKISATARQELKSRSGFSPCQRSLVVNEAVVICRYSINQENFQPL